MYKLKTIEKKVREILIAHSEARNDDMKYGLISSRANNMAFSRDSSYSLLSSLEVLDDDGNLERKADIFFKRTVRAYKAVR